MPVTLDLSTLGPLEGAVGAARQRLGRERVAARILDRDHTLWGPRPEGIVDRLGWIDSPREMAGRLRPIDDLLTGALGDGLTDALLLGMGGSSLAAEVYGRLLPLAGGRLRLSVLDSTDPAAIADVAAAIDPARTLYLPATKSGGTVETLSLLKHCYNLTLAAVGPGRAGRHFAAITDPGSGLQELAESLRFRRLFLNDPEIGGRYSCLSFFGLVPARLAGADPGRLLAGGRAARAEIVDDGVGLRLGAVLGAGVAAGRDKLTLIPSPSLEPLGAWIEQLIAESTGKDGTGLLPIDGEPLGEAGSYAGDRLFVSVKLRCEADPPEAEALAGAGFPVVRLELGEAYDVGAAMYLWKVATIVAAHRMGVNPFDQPNVESAKVLARSLLDACRTEGALPASPPDLVEAGVAACGQVEGGPLWSAIRDFLSLEKESHPRPYVAFHAYLPPRPQVEAALTRIRRRIRERTGLATTIGFGPRFLHSTGQLHKGDAGHGRFLQITCEDRLDLPIPDAPGETASTTTFGMLKAAQASGDRQALIEGGRAVLRLHLAGGLSEGLRVMEKAFEKALADVPGNGRRR